MQVGAFERLNPPWRPLCIVSKEGSIENGGTVTVKLPFIGNRGIKWKVKHDGYVKDKSFRDVQTKGFFSHWAHQHNFSGIGNNKSELEDNISYKLPLGPIGKTFSKLVNNNLTSMFQYRHRITTMEP